MPKPSDTPYSRASFRGEIEYFTFVEARVEEERPSTREDIWGAMMISGILWMLVVPLFVIVFRDLLWDLGAWGGLCIATVYLLGIGLVWTLIMTPTPAEDEEPSKRLRFALWLFRPFAQKRSARVSRWTRLEHTAPVTVDLELEQEPASIRWSVDVEAAQHTEVPLTAEPSKHDQVRARPPRDGSVTLDKNNVQIGIQASPEWDMAYLRVANGREAFVLELDHEDYPALADLDLGEAAQSGVQLRRDDTHALVDRIHTYAQEHEIPLPSKLQKLLTPSDPAA